MRGFGPTAHRDGQKPIISNDTCIPIVFTAISTKVKPWKQLPCPLADEWIKIWYTYIYNEILKVKVLVAASYLTLCDPMDCSQSGSYVQGIIQARILAWVAIPFSRGYILAQGSNPGLLHCRQILSYLSHQGLIHKENAIMPFVATWVDLEITLSELSQTEKNKYIITCMQNLKNDTNKHIYKTETDSQT